MKAARRPTAPKPLGDLVSRLVDPIVARKAGMTAGLLASWPEIAGQRLHEGSRPEKLIWPTRRGEDEPFEGATLIVACEGAFALRLQHETRELMARVNAFFGYPAVVKLKIVQRSVRIERPDRKIRTLPLSAEKRREVADVTSRIESPRLRSALERYGETVLGRNASRDARSKL